MRIGSVSGRIETMLCPFPFPDSPLLSINIFRANWKLGLFMYFSYFCLFTALFVDKYLSPKDKSKKKTKESEQGEQGCITGSDNIDASGFFHSSEPSNLDNKKKK
jgi:hypothetical protein